MAEKQEEMKWTAASAVWQIANGGPTERTLSAIKYVDRQLDDYDTGYGVSGALFDALVEVRGFNNLEAALAGE